MTKMKKTNKIVKKIPSHKKEVAAKEEGMRRSPVHGHRAATLGVAI